MPKRPAVKVSNPAASRLPRGLGDYSPSVPAPEPVTTVQTPKSCQLAPSKSVVITNSKASR